MTKLSGKFLNFNFQIINILRGVFMKKIFLLLPCFTLLLISTMSCDKNNETTESNDFVIIEGYVCDCNNTIIPIQGAIIGTSLDTKTAVSDAKGYFILKTITTANYSSTPYTIFINSPGYQTGGGTWVWGDHPTNQVFCLNH